jgi:hypothetical protein
MSKKLSSFDQSDPEIRGIRKKERAIVIYRAGREKGVSGPSFDGLNLAKP